MFIITKSKAEFLLIIRVNKRHKPRSCYMDACFFGDKARLINKQKAIEFIILSYTSSVKITTEF